MDRGLARVRDTHEARTAGDAIDWTNARFEHKLALAEPTGAVDVPLVRAIRSFNRPRNKSAHEVLFTIDLDQVKTPVGLTDESMRTSIRRIADQQLEVIRQLEQYEAEGVEVDIAPEALPYLRVLTPTRTLLFAFVVCAVRSLASDGALEVTFDSGEREPKSIFRKVDEEMERLTGGLFRYPPANDAAGTCGRKPSSGVLALIHS